MTFKRILCILSTGSILLISNLKFDRIRNNVGKLYAIFFLEVQYSINRIKYLVDLYHINYKQKGNDMQVGKKATSSSLKIYYYLKIKWQIWNWYALSIAMIWFLSNFWVHSFVKPSSGGIVRKLSDVNQEQIEWKSKMKVSIHENENYKF